MASAALSAHRPVASPEGSSRILVRFIGVRAWVRANGALDPALIGALMRAINVRQMSARRVDRRESLRVLSHRAASMCARPLRMSRPSPRRTSSRPKSFSRRGPHPTSAVLQLELALMQIGNAVALIFDRSIEGKDSCDSVVGRRCQRRLPDALLRHCNDAGRLQPTAWHDRPHSAHPGRHA